MLRYRYIIGFVILALLASGIVDYIRNFEENGCEMTWMFEYPKYMRIKLDDSIVQRFPKYGLYIYGEGDYAKRVSNLKLRGIPVLFIPGNAGSYRQVRSLGSIALRKAENINNKFEFNYFSVDLNEELVGLFGGFVKEQTDFVYECVEKILTFYNGAPNPPSSVVLVGHSMGGVIARNIFTIPNFDPSHVTTIITQATPHQAPPVAIDTDLAEVYERVNSYWRAHGNSTLKDVTVVSTGGGYRDILVRNGLSSLKGIVSEERAVSTCTMSVPKAWVSTDHLCAVWCRQMVLVTKRALFDIVDPRTLQVSQNADKRMQVFRHHFLSNPGSHQLMHKLPREITLNSKIPWEVKDEKLFMFKAKKMMSDKYFAIPVIREIEESITPIDSVVIMSNISTDSWVCYCTLKPQEDRCTTCTSLSAQAQSLPPLYSNNKVIRMLLKDLGEATHVVIIAPKSSSETYITVEQYPMVERHLVFGLPGIYDTIISYPVSVLDMAAMLQIRNSSVYYSLHLAGLEGPLRSYTAHIVPKRCRHQEIGASEGIVYTLDVPWRNESTYGFNRFGESGSLPVKLQSPKPTDAPYNDAVHLEMYLHPGCSYYLKLTTSPTPVMGQYVRFFGPLYPAAFVALLILALRGHFVNMAAGKPCCSLADAVYIYSRPFKVIPVVLLFRYASSYKGVATLISDLGLPVDDKELLEAQDLWFPTLPPLIVFPAFFVLLLHVSLTQIIISIVSTVLGLLFRCVPSFLTNLAVYVEVLVCSLALGASIFACGSVGILLCYFLMTAKVLWLYGRYRKTGVQEDEAKFNFYFTLLMLYLWLLVLNSPALVIWAKNFSYDMKLKPDPSLIAGVVTSVVSLLFFVDDSIEFNKSACVAAGWSTYMTTVGCLLYSFVSLYRVSYIITIVLVLVSIPKLQAMISGHLFPPKKKDE